MKTAMRDYAADIAKLLPGIRVLGAEPMSAHTSLGIGGPADVFIAPGSLANLVDAVNALNRMNVKFMPLGGGSNVLVRDGGIEGAVLDMHGVGNIEPNSDPAVLKVGAGVRLQELVAYAKREGLSGIEGLVGIPGLVGGAVVGNAGSFGSEIMQVVERVDVIYPGGSVESIPRRNISAGYRRGGIPVEAVVLSVGIRLVKSTAEEVAARTQANLDSKKATQPIGERSAGSVFKNPPGDHAARLIDAAGCKGMRVGGAEVSTVHAGFIINTGGASAADFLGLMEIVSGRVRQMSGVTLEPEIRMVGRP